MRNLRTVLLRRIIGRKNDDLRLEANAGLTIDGITDMHHEVMDVMRGSASAVYNEARVLFRDLCAADSIALQTGFFDQSRSKMTFRPAKCASRGRQVQRLFGAALLGELLHTLCNCLRRVPFQTEDRAEDNTTGCFLKITCPITESAVGIGEFIEGLVRDAEADDALDGVLEFAAVGTGVHDTPAAQCPRYAAGKLQTPETVFLGECGKPRKRYAGFCIDGAVRLQKELLQLLSADDKQLAQTLIREENIGPVAENKRDNVMLLEERTELRKLSDI